MVQQIGFQFCEEVRISSYQSDIYLVFTAGFTISSISWKSLPGLCDNLLDAMRCTLCKTKLQAINKIHRNSEKISRMNLKSLVY